MAISETKGQTQ